MSSQPDAFAQTELRERMREWRKSLAPERLVRAAERSVARLLDESTLLERSKGLRIALYRALPGELDPASELESRLATGGALLHYPRITDPRSGMMEMVQAREFPPSHWHSGPYGIPELPTDWPAADPASLDAILVPGLAFGHAGERLGMGAGYFDRYLIRASQAVRIALALDDQVFPSLAQREWDQPVDWVVTESKGFRAFRDPGLAVRFLKEPG